MSRNWACFVAVTIMGCVPMARAEETPEVLSYTVKSIDGEDVPLSKYKGKVVLIVNVASRCGLTPQYTALEELHEKYSDKGLAVLGFPCNQFLKQEPGTEAEIKEFCSTKYGVEFDMFSKVEVNGEGKSDLYEFLTSKEKNPEFAGDIKWNFTKFLLSKDGKVVARFEPKVTPDDEKVVKAIEAELAK